MRLNATRALAAGAAAFVAAAAFVSMADAQPKPQGHEIPRGWSYDIQDGKRVPKGNRVNNPDGSWREELRQGNCTTVKERSSTGEYRETRQCNPVNPG